MRTEFFIFFGFASVIGGIIYYHSAKRTIEAILPGRFFRIVLRGVFLFLFLSLILQFISWNWKTFPFRGPYVAWPGYMGFGAASLLFTFFLARDFLKFACRPALSTKIGALVYKVIASQIAGRSILVIVLILFVYGFYETSRQPDVVNVDIPVKGLHPDLEGLKIVQLSDVHVGPTIRRPEIERLVTAVNTLKPDIIAITGDLIDGTVADLSYHAQPLQNLRSHYGTFFVTGNHEYYFKPEEWIAELKGIGMQVLLNEYRVIKHKDAQLIVGGVTDYQAERYAMSHKSNPSAASGVSVSADFRLLLAHQPRSIFLVKDHLFQLILTGHTHGGQYFPATILVRFFQPFYPGLIQYNGGWIYINRGTGYWGPPLRIGSPSEITCFTLKRL